MNAVGPAIAKHFITFRLGVNINCFLLQPSAGVYDYNQSSAVKYHMKKPRVACRSLSAAERVCTQIRYAKTLASEHTETMQSGPDEEMAEDRAFALEV